MDWYAVKKEYIDYLKQFDDNVGDNDYGDHLKLYLGILLSVDGINYYVPISSPKPKHNRMSNQDDFYKVEDPVTKELYAVLNLNNMIPVPDTAINQITYGNIQNYRAFKTEKEKLDYIYLLQKEKAIIDALENNSILTNKAKKLYNKCEKNPTSNLAKRCCKFKLLKEKSEVWAPKLPPKGSD